MKEFLAENEIISSCKLTAKERGASIMYGTFLIAWLLWNWYAVYTTFFLDQGLIFEVTGQLKVEFIQKYYPCNSPTDILSTLTKILIGPAISTWGAVWILGEIDLIFFKKHYQFKIKKDQEIINERAKLLSKEEETLQQKQKNIVLEKEIQEELGEEDIWEKEFQEVKGNTFFKMAMTAFEKCLYRNRGYLGASNENLRVEYQSYLHVNGYLLYNETERSRIKTTPKGRYMLKRTLEDKVK